MEAVPCRAPVTIVTYVSEERERDATFLFGFLIAAVQSV